MACDKPCPRIAIVEAIKKKKKKKIMWSLAVVFFAQHKNRRITLIVNFILRQILNMQEAGV